MNLLPLCHRRQALRGANTPTRRFERILERHGLPVNDYGREKHAERQAIPDMVRRRAWDVEENCQMLSVET